VCTHPRVSTSTEIILLRKPVRSIAGILGDCDMERYVEGMCAVLNHGSLKMDALFEECW
jgi:hypothetical protein